MAEPQKIEVKTADGVAPCWIHRPEGAGDKPGIIFYPDAGSVRPAMHDMASKLAKLGYVVLLPDILYRGGDYAPFDVKTVFGDPKERERLMKLMGALDTESAMRDAEAYIGALRVQPGVRSGKVGCTGYCIGGRLSFLTAMAHADLIAAAGVIHGGGIATDTPDSPHLGVEKLKARLYFAVADEDRSCTPEQQGMLVTALAKAHVRYVLDHFKGASHGFAVDDFVVHDVDAAGTHWRRLEELFAAAFA